MAQSWHSAQHRTPFVEFSTVLVVFDALSTGAPSCDEVDVRRGIAGSLGASEPVFSVVVALPAVT